MNSGFQPEWCLIDQLRSDQWPKTYRGVSEPRLCLLAAQRLLSLDNRATRPDHTRNASKGLCLQQAGQGGRTIGFQQVPCLLDVSIATGSSVDVDTSSSSSISTQSLKFPDEPLCTGPGDCVYSTSGTASSDVKVLYIVFIYVKYIPRAPTFVSANGRCCQSSLTSC